MKWNNNGIKYLRGCYEVLIARFDDDGAWFTPRAMCTQQTAKSFFKELGNTLNAQTIEVKKLYDDNDNMNESDVIVFMKSYSGSYFFYIETDEDLKKIEPYDLNTICQYYQNRQPALA